MIETNYRLPADYPKIIIDEATNVSEKEWKKIKLMNELIKAMWIKEADSLWEECSEELLKTNPLYIWYQENREDEPIRE
jgi:hypothetical protein